MIKYLFNKIWPLLEPKLEKLIKDAVAEAVQDISIEVESLPAKIMDSITKLPVFGFLKGVI